MMHVQRCCFANLNVLLFAVLVVVAIAVAVGSLLSSLFKVRRGGVICKLLNVLLN